MKKLNYFIILFTVLLFSCKKFLEEQPFSFNTPSTLLQTPEAAESFMIGVYDKLNNTPNGKSFASGLLVVANYGTDDFTGRALNNQAYGDYQNYTYTPVEERLILIWDNFYTGINQASDIIVNIPAAPLPEAVKAKLGAESKFMRAFFYFHLVRMFGGVPLVTKPTTSLADLNMPRASIQQVYELIIKDLTEAAPMLPGANATPAGRATNGAALALLTKVYLTMGSYGKYKSVPGYEWVNTVDAFTKAAATGNQVLALTDYSLVSSYQSIFEVETENGPEIIFSVQNEGSSLVTGEGSALANSFAPGFINNINTSKGGNSTARPTKNLVNRYTANDTRKAWNIALLVYNGCVEVPQTVTYAGKFRKPCGYTGQHFSDPINFPLLRLADVILMVAEAEAENNGGVATPNGLAQVAKLRAKRFTVVPAAPTGNFLDFVFDERSRELCYEGQRWFDLARTGRLIAAVKSTVVNIASTIAPGNIQPKHYLFPIPQNEIDNNSAIENSDQNPGY